MFPALPPLSRWDLCGNYSGITRCCIVPRPASTPRFSSAGCRPSFLRFLPHRLISELFFIFNEMFFILFCLFATSIFHLRTGLWLAPFDVSYSVRYISRSILRLTRTDFSLLHTYTYSSFT
jgi:hypothetical protein